MVTAFITIKPHLAEYAKTLFAVEGKSYIQIPHDYYLYHLIANKMKKRPRNCPVLDGNLEIALPAQSGGKDALICNYISLRTAADFEKQIECLFWAHSHSYIDHLHTEHGEQLNNAAYMFMNKYQIRSISEDAVLKSHYRYRNKVRPKKSKRSYTTQDKRQKHLY